MLNLKTHIALNELSYKGNIGIMELVNFHKKATPEESRKLKELIATGKHDEAWKHLQKVTGTKLHESEEVVDEHQ